MTYYIKLIDNLSISATAYILVQIPPQKFGDPTDTCARVEDTGAKIQTNGDVLFRFLRRQFPRLKSNFSLYRKKWKKIMNMIQNTFVSVPNRGWDTPIIALC